jgi:hypothetical protein
VSPSTGSGREGVPGERGCGVSVQTREVAKWCGRCKSVAVEERVVTPAGTWWRYRCEGCGNVSLPHSASDHRKHVAAERKAEERRQRAEERRQRQVTAPADTWEQDQHWRDADERGER